MWWYVRTVVAWVLVVAAVFVAGPKVENLKLGPYSSRFVGALVAAGAYYYFAHNYWDVPSVWVQVIVPLLLAVWAVHYLRHMYKDRRDEFYAALGSSTALSVAVGLLVAARYLFSL